MSKVTITKSKLDNLANAVSAKSGEPVLLTVDEMTDAVLGISTGEENVLEGVKVNGQELPIVNKKVNIPAVTETQAGVMTPAYMDQIFYRLSTIPTNVSDLPNDAGYITTETDPTVPSWAKQSTKPTYTASEVGALPDTTVIPGTFIIRYNNTTGTADKTYTEIDTAKDLGYTILLQDNNASFYALTSSSLGYLFTSIDDLSTSVPPEGNVVKIKQIKVNSNNNWIVRQSYKLPIKVSDLTNDSGFITTETDPTVPSWAKQSTKPTYTATEVGAVATSSVGAANGVAPLNASSKIDETYLPSYVDDVVEGYLYNGSFYKESTHTTVIPGEAGKIYVDLATDKTYRYGGSTFVEISSGTTVSVSRDLTSGTKVGTITVNGTGTDFYAPAPPTAVSQLTNDSGYITGYTETDPVYSASAAAGITSSDITNWNNKVSDDHKWDDVSLNKSSVSESSRSTVYVPLLTSTSSTNAYLMAATYSPTGGYIPRYDASSYLYAATPSANDNSTKVATTAYVDAAVPTKVSDLTNDSGYIATETDPVFTASPAAGITSTDITNWNDRSGKVKQTSSTANVDIPILLRDNKDASAAAAYDQTRFASVVTVHPSTGNLKATTFNDYTLAAACAKSVDSSISASSSSTNLPTSAAVASFVENKGYLTLATLPIYDGTVV